MAQLRFDGRVAVVTGAGGNPSLGRAYALLLAARGAKVVVNDIGALPAALGYTGTASAQSVVDEIVSNGGEAIADTNSVSDEEGAAAIVRTALEAFGGIDILVNNAGICRVVSFEDMTSQDFRQSIDVNLMGTVHTCRAAWPYMKSRNYGRIINVVSGSMTGLAWQTAYAAAKGGVFSFTRSLASEGMEFGIRSNALAPAALTRMVYAAQGEQSSFIAQARERLLPEKVAPAVAFMAHEDCPFTGECLEVIGDKISRFYLARTTGFEMTDSSPEEFADRWPEAMTGTPEGLSRHDEADPREWSPKPYIPS